LRRGARCAEQSHLDLQRKLYLGNLDAERDWGFAGDYVEAMWLMLQQGSPQDFVISMNERHSVREFAELAFSKMDLDWEQYVEIDPRYFRPTEVELLLGDPAKAKKAPIKNKKAAVKPKSKTAASRKQTAASKKKTS
jgi:GDPmannose 4,6-dehydratase